MRLFERILGARFEALAPEWSCTAQQRWLPSAGGDGFFGAIFTRK